MKDIGISVEAQKALTKLLHKLGLISELHARDLSSGDTCPISFYARQGLFEEHDAIHAVAKKLEMPVVVLDRSAREQYQQVIGTSPFSGITLERWQALRALPLESSAGQVTIAFANPLDQQSVKALAFDLGVTVRAAIASEDDILETLARKMNSSHIFDLSTLMADSGVPPLHASQSHGSDAAQESNVFSADVAAPPVVRLVNKILADGVQACASDIHINPERSELKVKLRVDGAMTELFSVPAPFKQAVTSRIKLLSGMDIAERRKPQDGRLRIKTGVGMRDLRLSTIPTVHGENIVIRILAGESTRLTLDTLGADAANEAALRRALKGSSRVVLVSGPTGSGKTSTLYASLCEVNDGTNNVITIEDPIEYRLSGVQQIQVNNKLGMGFAEGLRSILRQDPDVIMVGEIRDGETAQIALQAAQTGHLVLSTVHANSAPAVITRLRDLGIPNYLLASSLGTIIAQRLVRALCPHCAETRPGDSATAHLAALGIDSAQLRHPKGCDECAHTGYKGRLAIFSVLEVTDAVRTAIHSGAGEQQLEVLAAPLGYRTLLQSSLHLLRTGQTSLAEIETALGPLVFEAPKLASDTAPATKVGIARRRLLLVEDDENTRMVLSLLFNKELFEVTEACDGLEALERLYAAPPELIVCDLMMPRMNGFEFVRRLRMDARTRAIPVLMLTAANTESHELESITEGADDFVSKTADSKVMLARVHRLLSRTAG